MHLGSPITTCEQLIWLSHTGTPRLGNIVYAISCSQQRLALQLEEAALSFSCFAIAHLSMSVQVFVQPHQTRSGNQSVLNHSGAGEVLAGSEPQDGPIHIREGMAQELKQVSKGRRVWLFQ